MAVAHRFDVVLVGGGLQCGLIALATLAHRPDTRIALVERERRPGGNHTWCLHADDVPSAARHWVDPLVVHRWRGYDVRFPTRQRRVDGSYAAVTSDRFATHVLAEIERAPQCVAFLGKTATEVRPHRVSLDDGRELTADLVVDARGPGSIDGDHAAGFQTFVGLELELQTAHGLQHPLLIDAEVEQRGGFRFFYLLPFGPRRLLVENTLFSPSAELDAERRRNEVLAYAARFGRVASVLREESGVLPMPWAHEMRPPRQSPLRGGYGGGWFHPATGYSFPAAIRLAQHVGTRPPTAVFDRQLQRLHRQHCVQARFARKLNWLLFHGFAPRDMWHAFERFYRLPDAVIHRFYAMNLSLPDRARILSGRPPAGFDIKAAVAAVSA